MDPSPPDVIVRSELRSGDLREIVTMHAAIYAREHGFDRTFEAYVPGPLAEFASRSSARERIWIAEGDGGILGCVAIVAASDDVAQLRWFLVDPAARSADRKPRLPSKVPLPDENGRKSRPVFLASRDRST